jgi:hypothetical protein
LCRPVFLCFFYCCSTTYEPAQKFPQLIFLKELSFRTSDAKHAARVVQEIKVLRSTVLQRDKERAERATLVKQEKLVRGKVRLVSNQDGEYSSLAPGIQIAAAQHRAAVGQGVSRTRHNGHAGGARARQGEVQLEVQSIVCIYHVWIADWCLAALIKQRSWFAAR